MRRPSRRSGEVGVSLVETALMLPVIFILLIGLLDVARAVWFYNTLASAVREGTRYAIVHGANSATPSGPGSSTYTAPDQDTAVASVVRQNAVGVASVTVAATWPDGTNGRGDRVKVVATVPFTPALSSFFVGNALAVTLRAESVMVIER